MVNETDILLPICSILPEHHVAGDHHTYRRELDEQFMVIGLWKQLSI